MKKGILWYIEEGLFFIIAGVAFFVFPLIKTIHRIRLRKEKRNETMS